MPESIVYNMDCLEAMKQMSDNAFDLAVADPPYGINITGRHRERERASLSVVSADRSVEMAKPYGAAKSNLANQNFILCSMMAPHRTQKCLGSCNG